MTRTAEILLTMLLVGGLSAAEAPVAAEAALGSKQRPVRCDGVGGERWYLSRLRTIRRRDPGWSLRLLR